MFVHHLQTQRLQREAAHQLAAKTAGAKLTIDHARQRHALATQCRRALGMFGVTTMMLLFLTFFETQNSLDLYRIDALKARHELARQRTEEMHIVEVLTLRCRRRSRLKMASIERRRRI